MGFGVPGTPALTQGLHYFHAQSAGACQKRQTLTLTLSCPLAALAGRKRRMDPPSPHQEASNLFGLRFSGTVSSKCHAKYLREGGGGRVRVGAGLSGWDCGFRSCGCLIARSRQAFYLEA